MSTTYGFSPREKVRLSDLREAWQEAEFRKDQDEFYSELLKFVADQPNAIGPGSIGEQKAQIAKRLVSEDPVLASPEKRAELMDKIQTIYDRDHAVHVTLSEEDEAPASD